MTFFYCAAAIILFIILCVVVIYHDTHNFVVRTYDLESDKIKGDRSMIIPPEGKEKIYKGIYELTGIDPHETESIYVRKHKLWSYVYLPVILFAVCALGFILSKFQQKKPNNYGISKDRQEYFRWIKKSFNMSYI